MKAAASQTNKGGGVAGKADRLGGAAGHAKFKCPICAQQAPDMKTMQVRRPEGCAHAAPAWPPWWSGRCSTSRCSSTST